MTTKPASKSTTERLGDLGNILLFLITSVITACMLFQFPSSAYFDSNWLSNGFCISNADTFLWNSHVLSFGADILLSAVIFYLFLTQDKEKTPPLQQALVAGAVTGVAGHGMGHLYLGLEPKGMDLRLKLDDIPGSMPMNVVTLCALTAIYGSTMPLASFERLVSTAVVSTAGFTLLDIPPKFNFIYAQAVIYISSALHMLSLDSKYKAEPSYQYYPWAQLPVLLVGILESTKCQQLLEPIGGHMIFDASIAIGTIGCEIMSRQKNQKLKAI